MNPATQMETLKTSSEFERVRRAGRTWASGPVVLNAAPNDLGKLRFGFVAGKKVGNAVKRNRARRLIREAVRLRLPYLKPGWDLIWIARASIEGADLAAVSEAVDAALHRGKLFAPRDNATAGDFSRIMYMSKQGSPPPSPEAQDNQDNSEPGGA